MIKTIQNVFYLFGLIFLSLDIHFSLSMETDTKYNEIKQQLYDSVKATNYDDVKNLLNNYTTYLKDKFITNYDNYEQIKNYKTQEQLYTQNLLFDPEANSIITLALDKKNLNVIYMLAELINLGSENDFYDYLNQHLKIDPTNDDDYLKEKRESLEDINHDRIKNPQHFIYDLYRKILQKFVIQNQDKDFLLTRYFNRTIWPLYL